MGENLAAVPGPEAASVVRRLGPPAFVVALALAAAALVAPWVGTSAAPLAVPHLSLPVLFAVWVPFELVMLLLLFGDEVDNADSFMLTEIPLTLGLLFAAPADVLVVAVAAPVLLDLVRHNKSALKQLFNGVNRAVEVSLALTLFRLLQGGDPLSTDGWVALLAAATASSVVMSLNVSLVISLSMGWLPRRDFWAHVLMSVPMALGGVTIGFCAALALQAGGVAVLPLLGGLAMLLLLLRGLTLMTERHRNLVKLQTLGHRFAAASDVASVLTTSLQASAHLLLGRSAAAYLPVGDDPSMLRRADLAADGALRVSTVPREPLVPGIGDHRRRVVAAATIGSDTGGTGPAPAPATPT